MKHKDCLWFLMWFAEVLLEEFTGNEQHFPILEYLLYLYLYYYSYCMISSAYVAGKITCWVLKCFLVKLYCFSGITDFPTYGNCVRLEKYKFTFL